MVTSQSLSQEPLRYVFTPEVKSITQFTVYRKKATLGTGQQFYNTSTLRKTATLGTGQQFYNTSTLRKTATLGTGQ